MAKIGRNEPCPCGSGRKYKRCCGTPEAQARIEAAAEAVEEALALAEHFPQLRPRGDAFAEWAERAARDPREVSIGSGIALLEEAEWERILRTCAEDQPQAWRSLCADAGDTALVESVLLSGAVLAGVSERCPIDAFRFAYLEQRASVERPFEALSWVLDGNDLWSVIESAEADAALDALD